MTETRLKTPPEPSAAAQEPMEQPLRTDRPTFTIRPAPRWPHLDVRELWHYREVLATIVWRDIVVRYKQTFLGIAWALLVPALTTTVYVVVFGKFAKFPAGNTAYPSLVISRRDPDAVLRILRNRFEHEPRHESAARDEGLLSARPASIGCGTGPIIDLLVALPVLLVLMAVYGTWPDGPQVVFAPLFLALAAVHCARNRLSSLCGQRALARRAAT